MKVSKSSNELVFSEEAIKMKLRDISEKAETEDGLSFEDRMEFVSLRNKLYEGKFKA